MKLCTNLLIFIAWILFLMLLLLSQDLKLELVILNKPNISCRTLQVARNCFSAERWNTDQACMILLLILIWSFDLSMSMTFMSDLWLDIILNRWSYRIYSYSKSYGTRPVCKVKFRFDIMDEFEKCSVRLRFGNKERGLYIAIVS